MLENSAISGPSHAIELARRFSGPLLYLLGLLSLNNLLCRLKIATVSIVFEMLLSGLAPFVAMHPYKAAPCNIQASHLDPTCTCTWLSTLYIVHVHVHE